MKIDLDMKLTFEHEELAALEYICGFAEERIKSNTARSIADSLEKKSLEIIENVRKCRQMSVTAYNLK